MDTKPKIFKCPDCLRIWIHHAGCNYFYRKDATWPKVEMEWSGPGKVKLQSCMSTMEDPPECPAVINYYRERDLREKKSS